MKKEKIYLTEEELEDFDITGCDEWELRSETYVYVDTTRTDTTSDGPSWDTIVKRQSDGKFFKWNCWDTGHQFCMEHGNNYMEETFPKQVTITIYE